MVSEPPLELNLRVGLSSPGFCFDDVQQNCGFELLKADTVQVTDPPAEQELDILRHQVHPYGYVIGRG